MATRARRAIARISRMTRARAGTALASCTRGGLMRAKLAFAIVVVCAGGGVAHALTQPDGTPIPTKMGCDSGHPTGLAPIFASQCTSGGPNIGAACPGNTPPANCDNGQHGTCETTIWHAWNDDSCIPSNLSGLSPQNDASTTPETFQPTCALTF